MTPPALSRHTGAAKARLVHLAGISARTHTAEQQIKDLAEQRLSAVDADLAKLQPRALADSDSGDRYQVLTHERGQLLLVIAKADRALSS